MIFSVFLCVTKIIYFGTLQNVCKNMEKVSENNSSISNKTMPVYFWKKNLNLFHK